MKEERELAAPYTAALLREESEVAKMRAECRLKRDDLKREEADLLRRYSEVAARRAADLSRTEEAAREAAEKVREDMEGRDACRVEFQRVRREQSEAQARSIVAAADLRKGSGDASGGAGGDDLAYGGDDEGLGGDT